MKSLSTIFNFYVFSNLHVTISVMCLVFITGRLFEAEVIKEAFFLGTNTFVAYHLIRYLNRFKYGKIHLLDNFSNSYKKLLFLMSIVASLIAVYLSLKFYLHQLLRIVPFGVLTLFYAFSFVNIKGGKYSIRYIPGLKIFIIAFVWAGVVVFFINDFTKQSLLYFVELSFFILALTIPFDIRDLHFDTNNIKTLPMLLGVKGVKIAGVLFLIISVILHQYNFNNETNFIYFLINSIASLFLIFSNSQQNKYYASFWVESLPILYYLILVFIN